MGSFARIIKSDKVEVPQEKRKELGEKMYKLMTFSGMMDVGSFSLYGKAYRMLKPIQFNDNGFYFNYNYFEDDFWEDAGYDEKEGRFWSNKVGHLQFADAIMAGYALEGAYLPGLSAIAYDGTIVAGCIHLMWANTVLGEHYESNNQDPWEIYLLLKKSKQEGWYSADDFRYFRYTNSGLKGLIDIIAVTKNILHVLAKLEEEQEKWESDEDYKLRLKMKEDVLFMLGKVFVFKEHSTMPINEQYEYLLGLVRDAFIFSDKKELVERYKAQDLDVLFCKIQMEKYAGIIGKIIANIYKKDFWEVWERIKDVAKRDASSAKEFSCAIEKIFKVSKDDLLYFWTEEEPIEFSEAMQKWLHGLKERFDEIMAEGVDMHGPLRRIMNTMDFGQEHYWRLYVFEEFMNETLDNITDSRYMALWKLFDELLHEPENLQAASVLFEIAHPNWDGSSRKGDYWGSLSSEDKFNKGRQAMRRFLALVANIGLRKKVFGF